MPKRLKEEIRERLQSRAEELGVPEFVDMIADETVATTEEEVMAYMEEKGHPALTMEPILE
jgi:acetyl-CoA synthase